MATHSLSPGLYLVASPIGNPLDITLRALDCLNHVHSIFCEDTRVTGQLLKYHKIDKDLFTYHEHNAEEVRPEIIRKIKAGEAIALVSDAGTPTISDPGFKLVREIADAGMKVSVLPGACAAIAGLALSGLPTDRFYFAGFLPSKSQARKNALTDLRDVSGSIVFYENKNRIVDTMEDILEVWGDCQASVIREITKPHEERLQNSVSGLITVLKSRPLKGEIVLVIDRSQTRRFREDLVEPLIKKYLNKYPLKKVAQMVSEETGVSKNTVYERAVRIKDGKD